MKKLLFIFAVLLFSCEDNSCYECTRSAYDLNTGEYLYDVESKAEYDLNARYLKYPEIDIYNKVIYRWSCER